MAWEELATSQVGWIFAPVNQDDVKVEWVGGCYQAGQMEANADCNW